ncbi:MAG: transglutaminase domain-containing protein [Rhizomicrobium sp.]
MKSLFEGFRNFSRIQIAAIVIVVAGFVTLEAAQCYAIVVLHSRQAKALINIEQSQKDIVSLATGNHNEFRTLSLLRLSRILDHTIPSRGDTFAQAIDLRNAIYQRIPLRSVEGDAYFVDLAQIYSRSMRDDDMGQICGGLTILYMAALEARGIPARYVGIFSKSVISQKPDTHASVEFYDNGRWIASDPTFNVMFTQNGRFLSYAELYRAVRHNQPYNVVSNGFPLIEGRRLDQYYISLKDLMKFVVIDPARVYDFGSDNTHDYKMEILPASWDGMLVYPGDKKLPAGHPSGPNYEDPLYGFLEKGPLR